MKRKQIAKVSKRPQGSRSTGSKPAQVPGSCANNADGAAGVRAWIVGVKLEHRSLVNRIDALIGEVIPDIRRAIKWRKPSQPLGVPFYGLPGQGWIAAMWSFKDRVGLGFIAGTLLDPEPPVTSMAGPWNRGASMKARRIDIHDESEFDEAQIRSWLEQVRDLPGWGDVSAELE
jgi:hypothetical protein